MTTALSVGVTESNVAFSRGRLALTPDRRWLVLVLGVILLTSGPAVFGTLDAAKAYLHIGWFAALYFGITVASAIAPSFVLAICAALNWRPVWQRALLFVPAFATQVISYLIFWCGGFPVDRSRTAILLSPMVVMAAASPALLLRLWRQWFITPSERPIQPKPASIVSLMLIMTCWAAAAACTQGIAADGGGWLDLSGTVDEPGIDVIAKFFATVILLLIPGAFLGLALVLLLRAALVRSASRACLLTFVVAITTLSVAVGSVVGFVRLTFQVDGGPPPSSELLEAAIAVGSFCPTMLAVALASFLVLRLLGYRLMHRGMLLESL